VDAGHSYCLIRQADGELARLTERSLPVGVLPDEDFHEGAVELSPGDTLVVYSDGLIEAPAGGMEELEVEPEISSATSAEEVVSRLMSRMPTRPVDDITVVALRRL